MKCGVRRSLLRTGLPWGMTQTYLSRAEDQRAWPLQLRRGREAFESSWPTVQNHPSQKHAARGCYLMRLKHLANSELNCARATAVRLRAFDSRMSARQ